jgi:hypothetical protein
MHARGAMEGENDSLNTIEMTPTMILFFLASAVLWFILAAWTYNDARMRGMKARKWFLLVLFFNIFGLIVYLAYAKQQKNHYRQIAWDSIPTARPFEHGSPIPHHGQTDPDRIPPPHPHLPDQLKPPGLESADSEYTSKKQEATDDGTGTGDGIVKRIEKGTSNDDSSKQRNRIEESMEMGDETGGTKGIGNEPEDGMENGNEPGGSEERENEYGESKGMGSEPGGNGENENESGRNKGMGSEPGGE